MVIPKREKIMMCAPFSLKRFASWGNEGYLQSKLNGERCRITWSNAGKVNMRSSYNKEIISVPHIYQALSDIPFKDTELDGELYKHGLPLQGPEGIQSIVSRTVNLHHNFEVMQLHIFDEVNDNQQIDRFKTLWKRKKVLNKYKDLIQLVPYHHITSMDDLNYWLLQYMELGFEGIVLRKINGVYQRDIHSTQIMKLKPRKDDHYIIIGVKEEIDKDGCPKDSLGAFICKAKDVDEEFRVGTGRILTYEGRQKYWKEPPIGKILHIKYQELTPNGIPYAPVAFDILDSITVTHTLED